MKVIMATYRLITLVLFLGLSMGSSGLAWSENSPTGEDKSFQVSDKNQKGSNSTDQSQLYSPVKPAGEGNFLILNPDGNTVSNYQEFLSPLDQMDKKPNR
jgi:hypothetical protein